MAEVSSIDVSGGRINLNLRITKEEYELLRDRTSDILLLPADKAFFERSLTTGKLGNSNRIMLPKKILKRFNMKKMKKKVPAMDFILNGDIFLLIKLKESEFGIPKFRGVKS